METSEYPSLPEQGKNLAKFTFEVVKQVLNHQDAMFVSPEIRNERMEICKSCEYYDDRQVRCRHCGCFLEQKVKFAIDSCPLSKWKSSDVDWIEKGGFDQVVDELKQPEKEVNHPLFPFEAEIGELFTWRDHTWSWNGTMWDYVYPETADEDL
jgi:hypothetical protein